MKMIESGLAIQGFFFFLRNDLIFIRIIRETEKKGHMSVSQLDFFNHSSILLIQKANLFNDWENNS